MTRRPRRRSREGRERRDGMTRITFISADGARRQEVDAVDTTGTPRSLWAEAGRSLVRNPVFVISALLILAGAVTALPLIWFAYGARRISLSLVGVLTLAALYPVAAAAIASTASGSSIGPRTTSTIYSSSRSSSEYRCRRACTSSALRSRI